MLEVKNQVYFEKYIKLRILLDYLTIRLIHKIIHHSTLKKEKGKKKLVARKKVLRKHKIDIDENEILFLPSLKFTRIKTFDHISPIDLMVGMCFKQNLSNIEKVFHVMAFDISVCVVVLLKVALFCGNG